MIRKSVLVVDDEPGMRAALAGNLEREGWQVDCAGGTTEALEKFSRCRHQLVLSDVRMGEGGGLQVLRSVRKTSPYTAVILLTAYASVPEAVLAMQVGASDYLIKPFSFDQLKTAIGRVLVSEPRKAICQPSTRQVAIAGESPALLRALDRAAAAARTDADILIEAESGTGKELLARFVHQNSPRKNHPFVALNCAAVPEALLESELFGHARGAFTGAIATKPGKFERASRGTLLLDEVGEMPLSLQPKLLRVLQEREFERVGDPRTIALQARIIATANVSLKTLVESNGFRSDLYYRLNVIPLSLPPLRERRSDIPILAEHFARQIEGQDSAALLTADFLERLQQHSWPGNVRELQNLMKRLLALHQGDLIDAKCLDEEVARWALPAQQVAETLPALVPGIRMQHLERQLVEKTLLQTNGNRTRAAELLGISVRTIRNRIREYGIPPRRYA